MASSGAEPADVVQRQQELAANLAAMRARVEAAAGGRPVRLVAVSKTKPVADVLAAYACGQRDFGENYIQELVDKASALPRDIRWRFIGHLQSNKAKLLAAVDNLAAVETIDSARLATLVDKAWGARADRAAPLDVLAQVNTSREENKHGLLPDECVALVRHIRDTCSHLRFRGLMTIGEYAQSVAVVHDADHPNPDFVTLLECRDRVVRELGIATNEIELSMGMSHDFEHAIRMGSSNVRVGSSIFGARQYDEGKTPEDVHKQRTGGAV